MRYAGILSVAFGLAMLSSAFKPARELSVSSPAFTHNGVIPAKYTCEGEDVSPPLQINNLPANTRSLAIVLHDPDAKVAGGFTHWVKWNIDPMTSIPEGYDGGKTGMNTLAKHAYKGMCPPDGSHRYYFTVYALDAKLNIDINTDKASLEKKMRGHILAEGELVGLYEKMK
ncbi:hypothetical protein GCM10023093_17980 [Nemorincola caseinilytica]|uniref:YbhB/YbcL family Raf kinase inhibitor-like protein n=1 Tax=Nemorincola caseinilytica TaxID=2054315 RepID=A0ABP8NGQ3_9BACT